jgi:phage gp29-like protein
MAIVKPTLSRRIRDVFGRIVAPLKTPDLREIATMQIRDRWSGYPSMGLTPSRLSEIFMLADNGYLRPQAELFEEIEEKDAHLSTCFQTRKLAVSSLDWHIEPYSEDPEDQKIAEFCEDALKEINDIEDDFQDLLDSIAKGYSMSEITWEANNGDIVPIDLTWIHSKKLSFVTTLTPRILTDEDLAIGVEPPPWKTIYHRFRGRCGFDPRAGVLRVVAYLYLLKIYGWKDWATFNEVYGMPLRVGKYPPGMSEPDKQALKEAIRNLGSDAGGIISTDTSIEFVEGGGRSGSGRQIPFAVLINQINREMSKAVLGQTLTTDTEGATGTYAAGKIHADVRQDIVQADARSLQVTLRAQLLRPLVGFNFGWDKPVPHFKFEYEEGEDLKEASEVVKNLSEVGYPFTAEYISERFGVDLPTKDGDEMLLVPPSTKGGLPAHATPIPPGDELPPEVDPNTGAAETPPQGGQTPPGGGNGKGVGTGAASLPGATPGADGKIQIHKSPLGQMVELLKEISPNSTIIDNELRTIDVMTDNEDAVTAALRKAAPIYAKMLAPIMDVVTKAKTIEEARDHLKLVYPSMPKRELAELLYQTMVIAWMRGRLGDYGRAAE